MKKFLVIFGFSLFSFLTLSLIQSNPVFAATCTWTGASSGNWNTSGNWSGCGGVVPTNGDSIILANGGTNTTTTNDISSLTINTLTSNASYVINGNDFSVSGGITLTNGFLIINPNVTVTAAQTFADSSSSNLTINGAISLGSAHTLTLNPSTAQIALPGIISGNSNIIKNGNGQVILSGVNTYGGTTTVNAGSVNIQNNAALGGTSSGTTIVSGATVNLAGGSALTVAEPFTISGNGDVGGGALRDFQAGNSTISGTIAVAASTLIRADVGLSLTLSGVISGSSALELDGTLILSNNNTINATASLGAGPDSDVTFNGTNTSLIINAAGNTAIRGSGSTGTISTSGTTTVAPGNSPGIFTVSGNMTLNSSDTVAIQLNGATVGSGYDQIQITGNATLANSTLNLSLGYTPAGGAVYTILQTGGTITGTFNGLSNGSLITVGGTIFEITYTSTTVVLTADFVLTNPTFTSSQNPASFGTDLTITSVWGGNGTVPGGTATLDVDGVPTANTVTLVNGVATFHISTLAIGSRSLTVEYSGDTNYNPAISSPLVVTITAVLADTGINVPLGLILLLIISTLVLLNFIHKKDNKLVIRFSTKKKAL